MMTMLIHDNAALDYVFKMISMMTSHAVEPPRHALMSL